MKYYPVRIISEIITKVMIFFVNFLETMVIFLPQQSDVRLKIFLKLLVRKVVLVNDVLGGDSFYVFPLAADVQ